MRRDGDEVLFLNELRHRKGTALKLRIPLSRTDLPAAMAVAGKRGIVDGKDYRGIRVLAAVQPISGSPWFMVTKMDWDEAFAVWRFRATLLLLLMFGAAALVPLVGLVFRQRRLKDMYRDLYRTEAALRESEHKYRLLIENAGETMLVAQEGMVKFVNRKGLELIGYSLDELTYRSFSDFIHPEDRALVTERHTKRIAGENPPLSYPFRIVDKSGNIRWVEINAVRIDWEGKPATLNFLADITPQMQAKKEHEELQAQLLQAQKMEAVGTLAGGDRPRFQQYSPA